MLSPFAITIDGVTKSFGKKVLFRDFTYHFPRTGIYAITGESGKGKTTLLRMIAGLDKKYSGEIEVNGTVSFMFQEHRLFPALSALDNLLEVSFEACTDKDRERASQLLSFLNLNDGEQAKRPDELSGGMKQRVSFARAILKDSDILLLDEPTKELDENLREKILEIIKSEARRRLVIIVSHNEDDLNELSATRIAI